MERSGEGETHDLASGETMDASDVSRAPVARPQVVAPSTDYAGLIEVDPKHYTVGDELARGGMGRIVRAHDRRLARDVAIKELLPRREDLRFEREVRITARLAHPAIVAIHEAGRWPNGSPFFAMKLVAGESLDKVIVAKPAFRDRLALVGNVIDAVDALAYAHSERVIHRDLKPANVLVGKYGETVVIDWGLAKDLDTVDDTVDVDDPGYEPKEGETVIGAVMGTPQYMSPEQADGARVDARTDVYALGALLYHVLAGGPPYQGASTAEVLARVLAEPPKPLGECAPETPMELIAIVERAMERDTKRRFQNAGEMADELRRFQTGQLIQSHRYTARELVRRWVTRNRTPIAVAAVALVVLAALGATSLAKIVSETHRADREAANANERADVGTIEHARVLLEEDPTLALATPRELSHGSKHWREARTIVADAEQRGVAHVFKSDGGVTVSQLAWNAAGTRLAAIVGGELMMWDLASGVTYRLPGPPSRPQTSIGWDGDDVIHVDRAEQQVSRWHPLRGGDDPVVQYADAEAISISPDGKWLLVTSMDGGTLVELATKTAHEIAWRVDHVGWEARSTAVLVSDNRSFEARRTDVQTGHSELWRYPDDNVVVANLAGYGAQWFMTSNTRPLLKAGPGDWPAGYAREGDAIAVLSDGRVATTNSYVGSESDSDGTEEQTAEPSVFITDGSSSQAVTRLRGHHMSTTALGASLGGTIASADFGGNVRVWSRTRVVRSGHPRVISGAFLSADRTQLVALQREAIDHIDLATMAPTTSDRRVDVDGSAIPHSTRDDDLINADAVAMARGADTAIAIDHQSALWVWKDGTGRRVCGRGLVRGCAAELAAISANGKRIAALSHGRVMQWDENGTAVSVADYDLDGASAIALSPEGAVVAVAARGVARGHRIVLSGARTEEITLPIDGEISALVFSPDATHLAFGLDTTIHWFDLATRSDRILEGHGLAILALSFASDGRLVSVSGDNTARIWNPTAGTSIVLRGHTKPIRTIEVLGDAAVTTSLDGTARLWDLATGAHRILPDHATAPMFAGFAHGEIFVLDRDGRLSRYTDNTPWGEPALRGWIDALTNVR